MRRIVLASGNAGKLDEIRRILGEFGLTVLAQSEFGIESPEESGATFKDNALIKARHAARIAELPAIADDSGLAVDALQGRPGVRSARYAGVDATDRENVDKLLAELDGLPLAQRSASFHCVAVFVTSAEDRTPLIAEGAWPGRILTARRGAGGFGYDPVFCDPATGKAAAQMTKSEKNRLSHRGQAFRRLAALLLPHVKAGPST